MTCREAIAKLAEYLDTAHNYERLAATENNEVVKQLLQEQAEAYHRLAKRRAAALGLPMPVPPQSK